jgi:esterase/lipase superfamily enzyme
MRRLAEPLLILLLAVLLGGCQSTFWLMPTPNLYTRGDVDPFPNVPPELQNNHVEVLYLTDRKPEPPKDPKDTSPNYGYKRSRSVAFGVADVEIGENLSWEKLEAISRSKEREERIPLRVVKTTEIVRFPDTPKILGALPPFQPATNTPTSAATTMRAEIDLDKQKTYAELSARLAKSPSKEVFVFVHGYNNDFNYSIMTIAQLWHFLGRRGVPIAYSWPAGRTGLLRGYTYDRESSEFTVYHFKEMIRAIAECPDVKKINIICHSRGTGVVVSGLAELHMEIGGSGQSTRDVLKLGSLVMAAPDLDVDVMIQRAVTVRLGMVPERTTIYVCANDKALGISNWLFSGVSRLGAIRSNMFQPDELETLRSRKTVQLIDAQISDPGPYGHSYFHASPAVSSDLILLMRYHCGPGAENGRPLGAEKSGFWVIDDKYPRPTTQPLVDDVGVSR